MKKAYIFKHTRTEIVHGEVICTAVLWCAEMAEHYKTNGIRGGLLRTNYDVVDPHHLPPFPIKFWNSKEEAMIDLTLRGFEVSESEDGPL